MKYQAIFLVLFVNLLTTLFGNVVTRGAIDIGSSETKLFVASMDTTTNTLVEHLYGHHTYLPTKGDLLQHPDEGFSEQLQQDLIALIDNYREQAERLGVIDIAAIATASFRDSPNGKAVADRIFRQTGVPITIVSQHEEGVLGLLSAAALTDQPPNTIISWDSGGGSFQLATIRDDKFVVHEGPVGTHNLLKQLAVVRAQTYDPHSSPNPLHWNEMQALATFVTAQIGTPPPWLNGAHVVALGSETSKFYRGVIATGKTTYTQSDINTILPNLVGRTDQELSYFPKPHEAVSDFVLIDTVMQHFGIETVTLVHANGSTAGMLISPQYWPDCVAVAH